MFQPKIVYYVSLDQLQNMLVGNPALSSLGSGDGEIDIENGDDSGTSKVQTEADPPTSFYVVPSTLDSSADTADPTTVNAPDVNYIAQIVDTTAEDLGMIVDSETIAVSSNSAVDPENYIEVKDESEMREVVENIASHIKPGIDVVKEESVVEFNVDSVFNNVKSEENSNDQNELPDVPTALELKSTTNMLVGNDNDILNQQNTEPNITIVSDSRLDGYAECCDVSENFDKNVGSPLTEADADFEDDVSDISEVELGYVRKSFKDDGTLYCSDESDNHTDVDEHGNTKGCQAEFDDLGKVGKSTKKKTRKQQRKGKRANCSKGIVRKNSKQVMIICEVCGEVKHSHQTYYHHKKSHHDENKLIYKCDECNYETQFVISYRRHKEKHEYHNGQREKTYKCDKCDKTFLLKCNLKQHMVLHSEVKPYHCQFCDKGFAQKNNYQIHMSKHLPDGRYSRDNKSYEYVTDAEGRVIVDDQNAWKFKRELRFKCEICGRMFRWNQDMKRHVKIVHEGVKPFQCCHCRKTFIDKAALRVHMNSNHGSVRQFKCQHCPKEYFSSSKLKEHTNSKHGEIQTQKQMPSIPSTPVPSKVVIINKVN